MNAKAILARMKKLNDEISDRAHRAGGMLG